MLDFDDFNDTSKRFFRTFEEANDWVERQGKKWVCCALPRHTVNRGGLGFEYKCREISRFCADVEGFETKYNSEEEYEEDCGKKWYCLEYQCTKVDENSQLVEGMDGYDTQEECEQNCVIPTIEPPTETPS